MRSSRYGKVLAPVCGLFVGLLLSGCVPTSSSTPPDELPPPPLTETVDGEMPMTVNITSDGFSAGETIPKKYTEAGDDVSPALSWSNLPDGTKQLALICDDPDAPTEEPWVHWVIYQIPADATGLPENVAKTAKLEDPAGALQGINSWFDGQTIGYRGPAPPKGHGVHHYHFKLYALDAKLNLEAEPEKEDLLEAMQGHILATGELIGTYER